MSAALFLFISLFTSTFFSAAEISFNNKSLGFAADVYSRLMAEAPANYEYAFQFNVIDHLAVLQSNEAKAQAILVNAVTDKLCLDVNAYTCPEDIEIEVLSSLTFESALQTFQLALERKDAKKSEHFYDLADTLAEMATEKSLFIVAVGSESNSFGGTQIVSAISLETGEVFVVGSGYTE